MILIAARLDNNGGDSGSSQRSLDLALHPDPVLALEATLHAIVRDRHRSREFIEFLKRLDAAYPASTAIKLILDNHSRTYRFRVWSAMATLEPWFFLHTGESIPCAPTINLQCSARSFCRIPKTQ
jgi:hypothetical protein